MQGAEVPARPRDHGVSETYLPAHLIALMFGVSRRTVQRWAERDHWRAIGERHDRRYSLEDASRTAATREVDNQRDTRVGGQVV